jgi:hypothetical protein
MATLWKRFLSLLGLTESNGNTNGQRKALVQRLNALPKLSDWVIDPMHSAIEFRVMHMGIVEVRGRFQRVADEGQGYFARLFRFSRGDRSRCGLYSDRCGGPRMFI